MCADIGVRVIRVFRQFPDVQLAVQTGAANG
jgi:hypothetical protein